MCVLGNYVLNYLATQPKLPNFVIQALVTLFARISKLGWFDSDKDDFVFRNVVSDVAKFLQVLFASILYTKLYKMLIIIFYNYITSVYGIGIGGTLYDRSPVTFSINLRNESSVGC